MRRAPTRPVGCVLCATALHCSKGRTWNSTLQRNFERNIASNKLRKSADRSLSQPWCSHSNTIHGSQLQKTKILRKEPQQRGTLMQPLHCILQHHVPNPHVSRDMATRRDNNHAAIPLRSARAASKTPYNYAHTNASKGYSAGTKNTKRPAPASHTSCPSSPAAAALPEKTQGFVPWLPPQSKPHATSIAHGNRTWLQSCSHSTAICNPYRFQNTLELRTSKRIQSSFNPPLQCGNKKHERPAHRVTHGLPFIAGCSYFTPKKHKVSCPSFLDKSHVTFMQLLQCILQHHFPQSTTSLRHHFPQPPPFVITTSPLPCVITTSPPFVMFCDVLFCDVFVLQSLTILFVRNSEDCLPTSFDRHIYHTHILDVYIYDIYIYHIHILDTYSIHINYTHILYTYIIHILYTNIIHIIYTHIYTYIIHTVSMFTSILNTILKYTNSLHILHSYITRTYITQLFIHIC